MRYLICIEASHQRGMGHLFRGLHLAQALLGAGHQVLFAVNRDDCSLAILEKHGFPYELIDSYNEEGWEKRVIRDHAPDWWINDRLNTSFAHARAISSTECALATFDDHGEGASLATYNFLAMDLCPARVYPNGRYGPDYIILNPAIDSYRKRRIYRSGVEMIIVSFGGSDTYGVTPRVVRFLGTVSRDVAIHIVAGPNFRNHDELTDAVRESSRPFIIHNQVADLVEMLAEADLVICAGGITLFEAAALGVPALTVANEPHEVHVVEWFARHGFSVNAGFHQDDFSVALSRNLERLLTDNDVLRQMGERGPELVDNKGLSRIISLLGTSS